MPRAHTPEERLRIEAALIAVGRARFMRHGLVRTTIAQLAADAGIGKGSFYRFHDSKESLFFAIHEVEEAAFERALDESLEACTSGPEAVRTLLLAVSDRLERHPFLGLITDRETLAALMVRLEPARIASHRGADRERYLGLARRWKARGWLRPEIDGADVFAVLTATFMLSLQRELMVEEDYRRATRAIAESAASSWCR